jgi:hypothetical protein
MVALVKRLLQRKMTTRPRCQRLSWSNCQVQCFFFFTSVGPRANVAPMTTTNSTTYTWDSVLAMVAAPTAEEMQRYSVDIPHADLIERGSQIRSSKILTDLLRFGGILGEFWPKATADQKRALLGFSEPLLKVLVYSGKTLADMVDQHASTTEEREANRSVSIAVANEAYKQGMDERERLATALDGVADLESGLEARIAAASGRVTDFETLAASLTALVRVATDILSRPASRAAKQLTDGGLDSDQIEFFEALAMKVKTTGEQASGARTKGHVTQADLDLQDGICLALMDRVMKVVNRAHERNPSIPRLTPIATRRLFVSSRKSEMSAPTPEIKPT